MQVDDKLAKEKLARICEALREKTAFKGNSTPVEVRGFNDGVMQSAQLIRNTDLTDCQPPMEDCSVTQAQVPPSVKDV